MQGTWEENSKISQEDAPLLIIPAIDLKGGKCVRLWQGIKNKETVYAEDPLKVAKLWINKGAKRLHIVDLDGAFSGTPKHFKIAKNIKDSLSVQIQYGGGIRSFEILNKIMQEGIDFAIIGTKALSKSFIKNAVEKFKERIIVSIDCKNGRLGVKGWEEKTPVNARQLAQDLTREGIKTIILTDITRDGTLRGVNIEFIKEFADSVDCKLIIAGGISSIEDIKKIKQLKNKKISGVIIGRALYTGNIKLEEALKI